jgi:hypothetical protein
VNLRVTPDLGKVVAAAKEAQVSIPEIHFVRDEDTDILEALSISIEGDEDAKGYFSWLLEKSNLSLSSI